MGINSDILIFLVKKTCCYIIKHKTLMEDCNFFFKFYSMNDRLNSTVLSFGSHICNQTARIRIRVNALKVTNGGEVDCSLLPSSPGWDGRYCMSFSASITSLNRPPAPSILGQARCYAGRYFMSFTASITSLIRLRLGRTKGCALGCSDFYFFSHFEV